MAALEAKDEAWPCGSTEYALERLIGRGAFANVYMATCRRRGERVALKVIELEHITTEISEISKEVQMMRMCCHPNVLCCHASFVSKSELYLVMPLMQKGSCLHIMNEAKRKGLGEGMAEEWLGYVLLEVLRGLEYLHENGHIHRDIKAGNVLLDPEGAVALADFGVSSWLVHAGMRRRVAKTFVGTPCWMAPEVMEQVDGYDYKADIWSFGITALELAKGFAPYAFHPPMKVLMLTIQEEPPSLRSYATEKSCTGESFSRNFKEMVRMCLQKEPRKRPTVHTLLNCKFFKTKRSVEPLVVQLLQKIDDISLLDHEAGVLHDKALPPIQESERRAPTLTTADLLDDASLQQQQQQQLELQQQLSGRSHPTDPGPPQPVAPTANHERSARLSEHLDESDNAEPLPSAAESREYTAGTTWTFDDGLEIVLKSESVIRRELDAKSAMDDRDDEAVYDDLEELMNQRGGELAFRKNQDVRAAAAAAAAAQNDDTQRYDDRDDASA